jgi:hypothetical protein
MKGQFVKGQSGNPKGRPPKSNPQKPDDEFSVIINKRLSIQKGDGPAEVTVDEALQHKMLKAAFDGDRSARREILKMIEKRDVARANLNPPTPKPVEVLMEKTCPDNADAAMLLLGIAEPCENRDGPASSGDQRIVLQTWAVQKALSRGRSPLTEKDKDGIIRACASPDQLRWPRKRS